MCLVFLFAFANVCVVFVIVFVYVNVHACKYNVLFCSRLFGSVYEQVLTMFHVVLFVILCD